MKMKTFGKRIAALFLAFLVALPFFVAAAEVERNVTGNFTNTVAQRINGFDFEAWTDHRGAEGIVMDIYRDGSFSGTWTQTYNTLFRAGRRFPRNTSIESVGEIVLAYDVSEFRTTRGATYLGIYGWTRYPLIEFYILDSWIDWNVMRGLGGNTIHHGTVNANGGTYDIVTSWRINQPSIAGQGMTTFLQIFSVRQNSERSRNATTPLSGTINVSAHFEAWERLIGTQTLTTGGTTHTAAFSRSAELHEVKLVVEGFGGAELSTGSGKVDRLCLRYGSNVICTANGCDNCGDITAPTPTPQPTPEPTPIPTPIPTPEATPVPTPPIVGRPAPLMPIMRFAVGSAQFTNRGAILSLDAAPFIDEAHSRTMVPFRPIAEGLGATVNWDDSTRTASFTKDGVTTSITVGEQLPNGMGTALIVEGRTFVPARYVSEVLGATIRWEQSTRAVYIYSAEYTVERL